MLHIIDNKDGTTTMELLTNNNKRRKKLIANKRDYDWHNTKGFFSVEK